MASTKYDFGLIGLGVMGKNFILNVADHGYSAIGYDLDQGKVDSLIAEADEKPASATTDKLQFIKSLKSPRKIMFLVPSGDPVDSVIKDLQPYLDSDDLLID